MIEPGLWDMVMRLRQRGISDARVMRALETVPRSRFCDPARAYDEAALPLPCGQETLTPLLAAQMLQLADIAPKSKVLVVGMGSGWLVGLAASLARRVYAVERFQTLLALADANLAGAGQSATTRWGDGLQGWGAQAPFDRIVVAAGLESLPGELTDQVAAGGRLVAVVGGELGTWVPDGDTPPNPKWQPLLEVDLGLAIPGQSETL